ncbi:hypothetical protein [Nocardioides silvaticus]|nr:hypothetical protein [Nocardioides silvaticus]
MTDAGDPMARTTIAVAAVIVVAAVALVIAGLLRSEPGEEHRSSPAPSPAVPRPSTMTITEAASAVSVLRDWDRARSAAWSSGDVRALRRIYQPGARVGAHDVAMLRRWVERGLRVRRLTMQVLSVELRVRTDRRIVLDVTDRLADAIAVPVGGGHGRVLPRDGLTTRRLVFRLDDGSWRMAAAYARPLATTAVTWGSENS